MHNIYSQTVHVFTDMLSTRVLTEIVTQGTPGDTQCNYLLFTTD